MSLEKIKKETKKKWLSCKARKMRRFDIYLTAKKAKPKVKLHFQDLLDLRKLYLESKVEKLVYKFIYLNYLNK